MKKKFTTLFVAIISLGLFASEPVDPLGYFWYPSYLDKYSVDKDWDTIVKKLDFFDVLSTSNSGVEIAEYIRNAEALLTYVSVQKISDKTQKFKVKYELLNFLEKYLNNERVMVLQKSEKRKVLAEKSNRIGKTRFDIVIDFPIYILRTVACQEPENTDVEKAVAIIEKVQNSACRTKYLLSFLDSLNRFSSYLIEDEDIDKRTKNLSNQEQVALQKLKVDIHIKRNGIRQTFAEISKTFFEEKEISSERDIMDFFTNHFSNYYYSLAQCDKIQKEDLCKLLADDTASESEKLIAMYLLIHYHSSANTVREIKPFDKISHDSINGNVDKLYKLVYRLLYAAVIPK